MLFSAFRLSAQLPQGADVPDFSAQDIEGQSWQLYDLLDEGRVVLLEVSTTWCQPCWAYHNGGALQQFYAEHGPGGDDKCRVFFVEADLATNTNCLSGPANCNNFTFGNWLNGATYPFIDNAALSDSLDVEYFPTIYMICPNKKIYQIGQLDAGKLWEKASGCPVASGANNAGIFHFDAGTELREICDTLPVNPSFSLINLGSSALTSATISLEWNNDTEQTLYWNGNLPLYGEALISLDPVQLSGGGILKTTITSINNGQGDDDYSNNVHNDSFSPAFGFSTQKVILKIKTDNFGAETYWQLLDGAGNVLYHGGNDHVGPDGGGTFGEVTPGPGAYASNVLINKTLELPGYGCYSIRFVDAYGDGMCCNYGNGYYRLYGFDNPTVPILSGGEFEAVEHRGFSVSDPSAVDLTVPVAPVAFDIYPNPAGDVLYVSYTLDDDAPVSVRIGNTLGQSVYAGQTEQTTGGEHLLPLSLDGLPDGIYFVHLSVGPYTFSRTFFKGN